MFVKYPRDFREEFQWDGYFPVPRGDFVQTEGLLRQPVPSVRPQHPGSPRAGGVGLSLEELFGQPRVETRDMDLSIFSLFPFYQV